jgi:hypothetical protein
MDSLIVREDPPLFEEFQMKTWVLLWRASRDGFTAREFHRRCDGHKNTLMLSEDTDGNVFGGFTPVEWESRTRNFYKGDDSLRSFLFTLRNPHGVPPRKFALKERMKKYAIWCYSGLCAAFGNCSSGCQLIAYDNSNERSNYALIGRRWRDTTYENDTRYEDFFTNEVWFGVKEIEVFEITS